MHLVVQRAREGWLRTRMREPSISRSSSLLSARILSASDRNSNCCSIMWLACGSTHARACHQQYFILHTMVWSPT